MDTNYQAKLGNYLELAQAQGASDLHLGVGKKPTLRIDGNLLQLAKEPILAKDDLLNFVDVLLTTEQKEKFLKQKEIDFGYSYKDKIRCRSNVYYQRSYPAISLRLIPMEIRGICLLYTSDAADDLLCVDLGGRRIIKQNKKENINKIEHS